jgi:hypothetical protein
MSRLDSEDLSEVRKFANKIWRDLVLDTRAAEIAEAAFVLPVMFMILLGIFWFGQAYSLYGTITRAAQEGARAGAAPYCTTCNSPNGPVINAGNAVNAALTIAHLDPAQVVLPASPPAFVNCLNGNPVSTCNGGTTNACVESEVQLVPPDGVGAGVCGISVSLQYPFKFHLPYTGFNNRQILLTGSATVRMENQ